MNRLFLAVLTSSLGAFMTCAPAAQADYDKNDMRVGVFAGLWCGYFADYHVDSKENDRWVFHGRLTFKDYPGLEDELWIEQYDDNVLRMIRYLDPENRQATQVVQTQPPYFAKSFNVVTYSDDWHYGVDCEGDDKGSRFTVPIIQQSEQSLPELIDNADLRSEPDIALAPLGVVPRGTLVRVLEQRSINDREWARISFFIMTRQAEGWVEKRFISS